MLHLLSVGSYWSRFQVRDSSATATISAETCKTTREFKARFRVEPAAGMYEHLKDADGAALSRPRWADRHDPVPNQRGLI